MNTEIEHKIENAPALDFGTIFNACIDLFKKVWLQGLITILLTMAMMIPFYLIIYLPLMAMGIVDPEAFEGNVDQNPIVFIPFALFFLVFIVIVSAISVAMQASFFRICKHKDLGIEGNDDYFYYLKKKNSPTLIKLAIATMVISILCALLCAIPLIYAIVPLSFITVVFAFNSEMRASEIIKTSFKLGNKKWLIAFGLMFVCGFLAEVVGLLMCVVGLFVTASFSYLPIYFIYKDVVGFKESSKQADLNELNV